MSEQNYWNTIYQQGKYMRGEIPHQASQFAKDILERIKGKISELEGCNSGMSRPLVWEWGCGNGRDAVFFAANGLRVVGLDIADVSIRQLNEQHRHDERLVFATHDFTDPALDCSTIMDAHFNLAQNARPEAAPTHSAFSIGVIYSRFTIHSVKEADASKAFAWAFRNLCEGGLLMLETRSVNDQLCGKGAPVPGERNAWTEDHYRRFTALPDLKQELADLGFELVYAHEGTGLAIYKEEDPCVIRIAARKPKSL